MVKDVGEKIFSFFLLLSFFSLSLYSYSFPVCGWFLLLLLPDAGYFCLKLKVDSSSWWVTNAGAATWPCEGEEGSTKYTSFIKSEKLRFAHRRELHWQINMAVSQLIYHLYNILKNNSKRGKKEKETKWGCLQIKVEQHHIFICISASLS